MVNSASVGRIRGSAFYCLAMVAFAAVGAFSGHAAAQTAQTITFAALAGKTYGNAPFTVSATASSGLPVAFSSLTTPVCTVSGTTVTIVAAGTCTIRASQAGNATYAPAPNVDRSFTVAKANQTITFGTLVGKTFGNAPFTVSATASSGLAVAFASTTTAVCTMSSSTVTIVAAGTCTIVASQAGNGNYNAATNVSRSFTVAKAAQTITFGTPAGKTYGNAPFAVSATSSSGLTVAFASTTAAICTVSATTVTIVAAGTCTIRASQAGNANYLAAPNVDRSFTVAKASQTITFGALANKTYGNPPFTVAATASSGLTVTFASLTTTICTVSGSTVTIVKPGTCTIRAAQAGNGNYNAAANVSRSFVIAQASQTLTFASLADREFGSAPFDVSASASSGLPVTIVTLTEWACTIVGLTVTLVDAGVCTLEAQQPGNVNYLPAASVQRSFNVRTTQVITFDQPQNLPVNSGPKPLLAYASSALEVTFVSVTPATCSVAGGLVTPLALGICTIRASQAGDAIFHPAAPVERTFSILIAQRSVQYIFDAAGNVIGIQVGGPP